MRSRNSVRSAFTLIELLLVMVIIVILASIVVPRMTGISQRGNKTKATAEISSFKTALQMFETDCGRFPTSEEGLQALKNPPAGVQNYRQGGYMEDVPAVDPWGHPYIYKCPGVRHPDGFDVYSWGPDGHEGGGDDIGNWSDNSQ